MQARFVRTIFLLIPLLPIVICRIHHLSLKDDIRRWFKVSSFGYLERGQLFVNVSHFSFKASNQDDPKFGFSVIRTVSDSMSPYMEAHQRQCLLQTPNSDPEGSDLARISFLIDVKNSLVHLDCSPSTESISIYDLTPDFSSSRKEKRDVEASGAEDQPPNDTNADLIPSESMENTAVSNQSKALPAAPASQHPSASDSIVPSAQNQESGSKADPEKPKAAEEVASKVDEDPGPNESSIDNSINNQPKVTSTCKNLPEPIKMKHFDSDGSTVYSFAFRIEIDRPSEEGLYSIFFHSCSNFDEMDGMWSYSRTNLTLDIVERNDNNYLSAGEIPLPEIYFVLSLIFFTLGIFWISVVKSKSQDAFKIHYIMGMLVFVKAFALLFHGINFQIIAEKGLQSETWAILYYITHFLKGALLFITIVLIGTGWAFIKHILSEKDKNLFMVVIPLQVLANIAEIITEESEEGEVFHNKWREIFILVDLLCCGAILFPVVWSIRHLQEAAHIDGKAATNLKKLKLFRRFYVIIVCYIYFTRIIVYLLKVTVPFKYEWMDALISHAGIFVFFVLTGYHFQPTPQNPYFRVAQDEDLELEEVLFEVTPNVYTENLSKKRKHIVEVNCDDQEQLITKREASHDFD